MWLRQRERRVYAQCGPVGIWSCGGPGDRGVFLGFCCLDIWIMVQKGLLG